MLSRSKVLIQVQTVARRNWNSENHTVNLFSLMLLENLNIERLYMKAF